MRLLVLMLIALGLLVGCGGDDDDKGSADAGTQDVGQLLDETFSNGKKIESGRVDASARVEGTTSTTLELSGPFQSEDDRTLPRFDLDAALEGGSQRLTAGITSTGDQGFVSYQGTDYEVSGPVFQQIRAAYEEAAKQADEQQQGASLATLGIDPRKWLTGARVAGDSEVGGTETIKITGGVDVPKLLDDINVALERARSLGLQGTERVPEQLTDEQKRKATEAVEDLKVEIDTGKDDKILRRLAVTAALQNPDGDERLDVQLDFSLLEVNEDQEIEAPDNPRPFSELLEGLQGLGLSLGATAPGAGSGGSAENLEKYSECVQDAGGDADKLRECGKLLNP